MVRVVEAKAVISAQDKTGNTFDNLAKKFKGVAKDAKALSDIKPPKLSGEFFEKELNRLKLTQREMAAVNRDFKALNSTIRSIGPIHPINYMRQIDDWRGKTLNHWREVKSATEEAGKAQEHFFAREKVHHREAHGRLQKMAHGALHNTAHIIGIGGGAYAGALMAHEVAAKAGERNREDVREDIAGWSPEQKQEAQGVADYISRKYPSISRTEAMADLRKNSSRLGSFDRAKAIAQDYARARIMTNISGGGEHELEQVVRAAEGAGMANTPEQFRDFINDFAKAKAVNADYTGEQYRADLAAAASAKYGWDEDMNHNVLPVLGAHTSGFGVKTATLNSALVGGRMTKKSKAALKEAGLLDKNGYLVDEKGFQANQFNWTQAHMRPYFEKKGVHFGEHMSEEDKRIVSGDTTKMLSAKNAADAVISYLLDAPLVEKARARKTEDIENADQNQTRDAGTAWASVKTQLGDFGTELANTSISIAAMNQVAKDFAGYTSWIRTGNVPDSMPGLRDTVGAIRGDADPIWGGAKGNIPDADYGGASMTGAAAASFMRSGPFKAGKGFAADTSIADGLDPDYATAAALRSARSDPVWDSVPLPSQRPFDKYQSPTTLDAPTNNALQNLQLQGTVEGSLAQTLTIEIKPTRWWEALDQKVDSLAKLVGSIGANGPGSTGKSSPDAEPNKFPGY